MKIRYILILLVLFSVLLCGCSKDAPQASANDTPQTSANDAPQTSEHQHIWETVNGVMNCTICGEVSETVIAEFKTLSGVPITESIEAAEKYLNIAAQNDVQNRASFATSDGWIYGQGWDKEGSSQFIKFRTDGSDFTVLDDGYAFNIYIIDDYIYYMNDKESGYGIYKMKTNGEDKQKISDACGSMQIVNGQIYYCSFRVCEYETDENGRTKVLPEYCHLYRCELDGSNITEIIAKPAFHAYVFEDGILYQDDNDNCSLHVCDLDGSNDIKLNDAYSYTPIYDGEYIFYLREEVIYGNETIKTIWKIKPDGSEDQLVADYDVSNYMVMTYENIFFVWGDDSDRLYRIDKDGSNPTLITQDTHVTSPQLFSNLIKYTKRTEDHQYIIGNYFCPYDGNGRWDFLDMVD